MRKPAARPATRATPLVIVMVTFGSCAPGRDVSSTLVPAALKTRTAVIGAAARVEPLIVDADRGRAATLGRVDRVAGVGEGSVGIEDRRLSDDDQSGRGVPDGAEEVLTRRQGAEIEFRGRTRRHAEPAQG